MLLLVEEGSGQVLGVLDKGVEEQDLSNNVDVSLGEADNIGNVFMVVFCFVFLVGEGGVEYTE
jgi:hypothetical protein